MKIHDLEFDLYLDRNKIQFEVNRLGKLISKDFENKLPLFLVILKGSMIFASDLLRQITVPCEIETIKSSSYAGTASTNNLQLDYFPKEKIGNRHIVIIEDIVDTGHSLSSLIPLIRECSPLSLSICTMLYKPEAFKGNFNIDYIGKSIPNDFVVGYGLDYNEQGRNLPDIYSLVLHG